jgi:hypothetical protein
MKHTPGPWKYIEEPGAELSRIVSAERLICGIPNESDRNEVLQNRCDAALIAAAPELFEALQELLWCPVFKEKERLQDAATCKAWVRAVDAIRAAQGIGV